MKKLFAILACAWAFAAPAQPVGFAASVPDCVLTNSNYKCVMDTGVVWPAKSNFILSMELQSFGLWSSGLGHLAIITRSSNNLNNSAGQQKVWGNGLACGTVKPQQMSCVLESWSGELPEDHLLYWNSESPAIVDNKVYGLTLQSYYDAFTNIRWFRYSLVRDGVFVIDSNWILDTNWQFSAIATGLAMAVVQGPPTLWSLKLSRIHYTVSGE